MVCNIHPNVFRVYRQCTKIVSKKEQQTEKRLTTFLMYTLRFYKR